ncbi:ATP-binding protein [Caldivirga maquilingensis]|uniref:AAA ATPase n=1 Tax=Caldivirga maquilingensis (strain ATCC 700844 / DSM 13496 / JCM 10307 / IC-167) TaxID=397948 RepID=A8MBD6_CALMQ|nr:ATP-binding protein [Caldivirga maquilingensis]ABW01226.1 AAA ATPase [Caldivirga maquilingensis IC-167]
MQSRLLATPERANILLGPSWRTVKEKVMGMINDYQLMALVGRAGSGKTHMALNICSELRREWLCMYLDAAQLTDKRLGQLLGVAVKNNEDFIKGVMRLAKSKRLNGTLSRFIKLSINDLISASLNYPVDFLTMLHDLTLAVGLKGLVLVIDEGALSQDDQSIGGFITAVHTLRNTMPRLSGLRVILTMLPDVVDYIAKNDPPLFEILNMGVVNMPDYVTEEDLMEVADAYDLNGELLELIKASNLSMRQVICVAELKDLQRCGLQGEVEVTIT